MTVSMSRPTHSPRRTTTSSRQRGVTLFGLMFWVFIVGFGAYLLVRVVPTINEYYTIQRTVDTVARGQPATVAEARQSFDRQRDLEFSISSITGKDISVTKENDKVVIGFAYDKLVPIYGPVFILIKYEGRSK